ncbi:sensor histidine kinase [uncultured Novosphingobium sp.]|uniref:sensor histidine kinase n=1 Tax=uncultured Novosphingobium sp. TaxID=292277 RepID=UPI003749F917
MTRLVEDLRSVSLAGSGQLELLLIEVDLSSEVVDMAPTLTLMLEPVGFSLKLDLHPCTARADIGRIRQAILALVDNASRHADPCVLTISTSGVNGEASITVADAGLGLPHDLVRDAFSQFVRGTQSQGGSGLGLAVVRGIARAHGGDVHYEADSGVFAFVMKWPT